LKKAKTPRKPKTIAAADAVDKEVNTPPQPAGPGRPTGYTPELGVLIAGRIAAGETLRQVCRDPAMPDKSTVLRWVALHTEFQEAYALARELLLEHWADEIVDIADETSRDWTARQLGEAAIEVANHEVINRSRLRIDTRKWLMSKLAPKKYGDKVALTNGDGGPIVVKIVD